MRCAQVAQLLNESGPLNGPDLREHIRLCADCRNAWEAERAVRRDLAAVCAESVDTPSWDKTRTWLDQALTEEGDHAVKSLVRHPFSTRSRRWGFSLATAAAVLAFLVLVPFSYQQTVGTQLVLTSADPALATVDFDALNVRLAERGLSGVTTRMSRYDNGASLTYFVRGSRDDVMAAFEATTDLLPVLATEASVSVKPWRVTETGSLLAQIGSRNATITVTTDGKTEEEIVAEIREQLRAQGFKADGVWVSENADGSTTMKIQGTAETPGGGEAQFEIENTVTGTALEGELSTHIFIEELDPNMTDEEKIAAIREQLAAQGITDAEISIDGENVSINVNKEEYR